MINTSRVAVLIFALAVAASQADETNLTLTVDGIIYTNVTFGTATPSSVSIFHKTGIARVPLAKLPPDLQKKFNYDPLKAADWQKREQQTIAERQKAEQQKALREKLSKTLLTEPFKLGMMGVSRNSEIHVIQVAGPDDMRAHVSTEGPLYLGRGPGSEGERVRLYLTKQRSNPICKRCGLPELRQKDWWTA